MHEAALAIGMILQRFKLIDVNRYQMHLKETLTIKPDGFKIKVRRALDKERGTHAGAAMATAAGSSAAAAPRARTRPGHNTPLLVAVRIEPRHGRGTRKRAWPISPRSTALRPNWRRSMILSANCRSRAAS